MSAAGIRATVKMGPHEASARDDVLYTRFDGDFGFEHAKDLMTFVVEQFGSRPYYAICDIRHQGATSAEARRLLVEWTRNRQLRAAAMIGGNAIARAMTRLVSSAIRIFNKQAVNVHFVENEKEAEDWIAQQQQSDQAPSSTN
ncbi:MAG: hypothetical protein JNJ46_18115 [Myxococcales bacterium]|nr:hypothetical protein [Myxococcales bacterium]